MNKVKNGKYLLSSIELSALIHASIEVATRVRHSLDFDPAEDALPFIVNRGYKLLHGEKLYDFADKEKEK